MVRDGLTGGRAGCGVLTGSGTDPGFRRGVSGHAARTLTGF